MQTGDFGPFGRFNQQQQPQQQPQQQTQETKMQQGAGAMGQPGDATQMGGMRPPQPPEWMQHVPQGLMEVFQRAPQVGLAQAFLDRYGKQFETLEGALDLVGLTEQADQLMGFGRGLGTLEEVADTGELIGEDEMFHQMEMGALAQATEHIGVFGGLYDDEE